MKSLYNEMVAAERRKLLIRQFYPIVYGATSFGGMFTIFIMVSVLMTFGMYVLTGPVTSNGESFGFVTSMIMLWMLSATMLAMILCVCMGVYITIHDVVPRCRHVIHGIVGWGVDTYRLLRNLNHRAKESAEKNLMNRL